MFSKRFFSFLLTSTMFLGGAQAASILGDDTIFRKDTFKVSPVSQQNQEDLYKLAHHGARTFYGTEKKDEYKVLSLDGGGVRGIGTLLMLKTIEDITNRKIYEMFDAVVGTSTGGIIALMLANKKTASEVLELYKEYIPQIFSRSWASSFFNPSGLISNAYSEEPLEELGKVQGLDQVLLKNMPIPCGVITTNDASNKPIFLNSLDANNLDDVSDINALTAIRATSAAPTYFPAVPLASSKDKKKFRLGHEIYGVGQLEKSISAIDGGLAANDPSSFAYQFAKKLYGQDAKISVHSYGTGKGGKKKAMHKNVGILGALYNNIFGKMAEAPQNSARKLLKETLQENYHRFNFRLINEIDLADASNASLKIIEEMAGSRCKDIDFRKYIFTHFGQKPIVIS